MTSPWLLVGGCAVVTAVVKASGPVAFGGRALPAWFASVSVMFAPALLAALLVTQAFTHGHHVRTSAKDWGVLVGGLVLWRTRSVPLMVFVAAGATAAIRALA